MTETTIIEAIDRGGGQTCDVLGVLLALDAAGYVIVPKAPTKEMCEAGNVEIENCTDEDYSSNSDGDRSYYTTIQSDAPFKIYQAMIGIHQ